MLDNGGREIRQESPDIDELAKCLAQALRPSRTATQRNLKSLAIIVGIAITAGSVIWSAATLATVKIDRGELHDVTTEIRQAHDADHADAMRRVEAIERNDVRQTVILERIDRRIERALGGD